MFRPRPWPGNGSFGAVSPITPNVTQTLKVVENPDPPTWDSFVQAEILRDPCPNELKAERTELLNEFYAADSFVSRLKSFVAKRQALIRQSLKIEQWKLQAQCRSQRAEVEKLQLERARLEQAFNRVQSEMTRAQRELLEAKACVPSGDSWPTEEQVLKARRVVEEKRSALQGVDAERNEIVNRMNAAINREEEARSKLRGLAGEERTIRQLLESGKSQDVETNLPLALA